MVDLQATYWDNYADVPFEDRTHTEPDTQAIRQILLMSHTAILDAGGFIHHRTPTSGPTISETDHADTPAERAITIEISGFISNPEEVTEAAQCVQSHPEVRDVTTEVGPVIDDVFEETKTGLAELVDDERAEEQATAALDDSTNRIDECGEQQIGLAHEVIITVDGEQLPLDTALSKLCGFPGGLEYRQSQPVTIIARITG